MSQAIAPDITSPDFWAWADKAHPGSLAATVDGGGLMALHTGGPQYFEAAKRWIPHPQGIRINLSLVAVGSKRDPSIAWHPDEYKAALGKAQAEEFSQSSRERRSPVAITTITLKPKAPQYQFNADTTATPIPVDLTFTTGGVAVTEATPGVTTERVAAIKREWEADHAALQAVIDDLRANPQIAIGGILDNAVVNPDNTLTLVTKSTSSEAPEVQTPEFTRSDLLGIRDALNRAVEDINYVLSKSAVLL